MSVKYHLVTVVNSHRAAFGRVLIHREFGTLNVGTEPAACNPNEEGGSLLG